MSHLPGKVFIVGAGPGSVQFLTLRGHQLLSQAEVVVFDALIDDTLLHLIPANCQTFNVGKRSGQPSLKQVEIDQLLVDLCLQGKQVIRLKSGDPFIFGRTTSEIQALRNAGCAFEIVPGLSSALAAPLLNGIPLTDPVLSRCFAILTAHEPDALDWEALSRMDTLVILMGTQHLSHIVERLLHWGRSPQTPIAILQWAGHTQHQSWLGTLETIVQKTSRQSLSPAVIVVGAVVALQPYLLSPAQTTSEPAHVSLISAATMPDLQPQNYLPLTQKTILVTRAAGQSGQFTQLLEAQGATVIEMPTLEIGPPSSWHMLDEAIAHLPDFDWLILTSTNGVDYFFQRLIAQGKDARALATLKIAVVGKKTAESLRNRGLEPDFIPPNFVADALVETFPSDPAGLKILFPRVETGGREVLVQEFTAKGALVTEVPAYQSGCAKAVSPEVLTALRSGKIDVVTFASSKTVQCFHQLLQAAGNPSMTGTSHSNKLLPDQCCIASIGPQTSITCQTLLGRVDVEATEYTLEGLTEAIVGWFSVPDKSL